MVNDLRVKLSSFPDCLAFYAKMTDSQTFPYEAGSLEDQVFRKVLSAFVVAESAYNYITKAVSNKTGFIENGWERLIREVYMYGTYFLPSFEEVLDIELRLALKSADFNLSSKKQFVQKVWARIARKLLTGQYYKIIVVTKEDEEAINSALRTLRIIEEKVLRLRFLSDKSYTLKDIGKQLGFSSQERVRAIEVRALGRLGRLLKRETLFSLTQSAIERVHFLSIKQSELLLEIKAFQDNAAGNNEEFENNSLVIELRNRIAELELENAKIILRHNLDLELQMPFANLSVNDLNISARLFNCLKNADLRTVKDICLRSESDLLEINSFGKESLEELKDLLAKHGLALAEEGKDQGTWLTDGA